MGKPLFIVSVLLVASTFVVQAYDELVVQVILTPSGSSLPVCNATFDQQLTQHMGSWTNAAMTNFSNNAKLGGLVNKYSYNRTDDRRKALRKEEPQQQVQVQEQINQKVQETKTNNGLRHRHLAPTPSPTYCQSCNSAGCRLYCYGGCNLCAPSRRRLDTVPSYSPGPTYAPASYTSTPPTYSSSSSASVAPTYTSSTNTTSSSNTTSSTSSHAMTSSSFDSSSTTSSYSSWSSPSMNYTVMSSSVSSGVASSALSWIASNDAQGCMGNHSLLNVSVSILRNNGGYYADTQFNDWFGM